MSPLAAVLPPLPADLAEPLHILPPWSLLALLAAVLTMLLALALLLWRRRAVRQDAAAPPPVPPAPAPEAASPVTLAGAIEALQRRYLKTKAFRDGCHALAQLIKTHLAGVTGLKVEEMTSAEIERAWLDDARPGGARLGRFMTGLALQRYGRAEPRRRHFVAACEEARELLA